MLKKLLRPLLGLDDTAPEELQASLARIHKHWHSIQDLDQPGDLDFTIAAACAAAERTLGQTMHDEQILGALALAAGYIVEMQTGEGKTLAAVPAAAWFAREKKGVHVMTVNDYLARRDAEWMAPVYNALGLTVGYVTQGMTADERRTAYQCDVTYATANECGFDLLRDQLCLQSRDQVHRPFSTAVIDEADSILIDEARIPLVIAGGSPTGEQELAWRADSLARRFRRYEHYRVDEFGRNISLTDSGIRIVERAFQIGNLFDEPNHSILSAVTDALHAHVFLRRDVDYIVKAGAVESVDEFKGRVAKDRRWPAGLHNAIEAKEGVALKTQGTILGSITLQNLVALYPQVCGMTGTAETQAKEFKEIYELDVRVIPTHKPVIRNDAPDVLFRSKRDKETAVLQEIASRHATGQPVLVGTASVEESERLSGKLTTIPHEVLNARHDEIEAEIIANAGVRGAVTISTNMAGRGTDIQLGEGVAGLGGLHVIGTNRHESRRIDNQLRGRAGRQGDPGSSQFFVSLEDDLIVRFGEGMGGDVEAIQRVAEGQNLNTRLFLWKYESVLEGQRQTWHRKRQAALTSDAPEDERLIRLYVMDELWSGYLSATAELRQGIHWVSYGGRDPLHEYLTSVDVMFAEMQDSLEELVSQHIEDRLIPTDRGATWTYLTTDQPFGTLTERIMRGMRRKAQSGKFWG